MAIIAAAFLFHQLYARVFAAVSRTLVRCDLRGTSLERTSEEAVLFYIRFEAADINRLTDLYTVHSPTLLVTTAFLLVSLLGAIILATVTTERATAFADIRYYGAPVIAGALLLFCLVYFADVLLSIFSSDLLSDLLLAL